MTEKERLEAIFKIVRTVLEENSSGGFRCKGMLYVAYDLAYRETYPPALLDTIDRTVAEADKIRAERLGED